MKLETSNGKPHRSLREAFSLLELIVVLAVIAMLAFLAVPYIARSKAKAERISCVGHLKNIGLAFRIFATDNNGRFPPQIMATNGVQLTSLTPVEILKALSNEISTPKIVVCPADKPAPARNFDKLTSKNISYFTSLSGYEGMYYSLLAGDRNVMTNNAPIKSLLTLTTNIAPTLSWSREMHMEQGNVAMGDGSVQAMSSNRLQQTIHEQNMETNYLAFP